MSPFEWTRIRGQIKKQVLSMKEAVMSKHEAEAGPETAAEGQEQDRTEAPAKAKAKAAPREKLDPRQTVGISDGGGNVEYIKMANDPPLRDITIDGVRYEAVSTDQDGVRIYRHLG